MAKGFTLEDNFKLTQEMKQAFEDDGMLIVKKLFDQEELDQIMKTLTDPNGILKHSYTTDEENGKKIRRVLWKHPGSDVTGIVSRAEKVVNTCEELLGGEIYHYNSWFILKNAHEGGQHAWHQDYGYCYKYNLFPDILTVWVPLDKVTRQNSCIQVLRGSNRCGRIDHFAGGGTLQTTTDPVRVEALKKLCPHEYCEMDPGDALFLNCNTVHMSSGNDSDMRRWAFICMYNRASNNPFLPHIHASYTPLNKVANSAIKECRNYTDFSGKEFVDPVRNTEDRKHFPKA